MKKEIKVALVHDFLNQYGGAERVLEVLAEMFPAAPIYTLLYDPEKMRGKFAERKIQTSFLQKFPGCARRNPKWLLPFLPVAPETFDLREYDLVISSSGAWSKGIVTRLDTAHVAYVHSPMRFIWDYNEKYLQEDRQGWLGFFIRPFLSYLRLWDKLAADRPDYLIANSKYTAARIAKYYRQKSTVIYPPVSNVQDISNKIQTNSDDQYPNPKSYQLQPKADSPMVKKAKSYFLIVSRLSPYKKIDKAIEAFNELGLPLIIAGTGKQEAYLKSIAKNNVKFLGWVSDEKRESLYADARAFIFPGVDDFGLAPAEATAHGVPVIALKRGGACEIAEEGKTGEFFDAATPAAIVAVVQKFIAKESEYDAKYIQQSAEKFSKERFVREMEEFIDKIN